MLRWGTVVVASASYYVLLRSWSAVRAPADLREELREVRLEVRGPHPRSMSGLVKRFQRDFRVLAEVIAACIKAVVVHLAVATGLGAVGLLVAWVTVQPHLGADLSASDGPESLLQSGSYLLMGLANALTADLVEVAGWDVAKLPSTAGRIVLWEFYATEAVIVGDAIGKVLWTCWVAAVAFLFPRATYRVLKRIPYDITGRDEWDRRRFFVARALLNSIPDAPERGESV